MRTPIDDLADALDRLDNKVVRASIHVEAGASSTPQSKTDFDRAVRRSIDRQHRKQMIAER